MNPATDLCFGKTPLTPSHGDSLADQSFQSLKSKEVRDSESPTREIKFRNSGGVAGGVLVPDTTGWNVQTSSEVSPDGRAFRTETLAKTDGVEKIPGGRAEFAGRNEQKSSASHQGDDKNFVKKAAESSKTHLQEKVVIGDENSGRTEMKSSSVTSSSSKVVSSSSSQVISSGEPGFELEPRRLTQDQQYQKVLSAANNTALRSEQQQYQRNERNERNETTSNDTYQENKKYVDMDKASPEYQQHVQYLMSQPGAIVSNTVEYPKPGVKMITTVKKLPDGTTVKTKRYETDASADNSSITQTMKQQQQQRSSSSTTQQTTEKRIQDVDDVFTRLARTRDSSGPVSPQKVPETPSQDDIYSRLQKSRVEQKFSDSLDQRSTQILRDSNQHPSTPVTRTVPTRRASDLVDNVEVVSTNRTVKKDLSQNIRNEKLTSADFIQTERDRYVLDTDGPSRRGPDGLPEALVPITPGRYGRPQPDSVPTNGYSSTGVIQQSSKSSAKFSESRRFSTETVESYQHSEHDDVTTHGFPSVRRPIEEPKGRSPTSGRPSQDFSTHGFPSVRSDKPTQQYPSERPTTQEEYRTTERVHVVSNEGPRPRDAFPQSPDSTTTSRANYSTNETRRHVTSTTDDFSTQGFPSVRSGTPTADSPRRPMGFEPTAGDSPRRPSGQEPPNNHVRKPTTDSFSTHGFPSVKAGTPTDDSPRRPSGPEPTSQGRRPTTDDFSTHGFPSAKPDRSTPTTSAPQYDDSPRGPIRRPPSVDRDDTISVTSDRSNSITYEKKIDAAHQAFARSLRCASPVESIRRDSISDRQTPKASVTSIRNSYSPSKRDGRSPSHESITNSESSRISSGTVTKSHRPITTDTRRVSGPKSPIGKSAPTHVSNETIDITLTRKITAKPKDKPAGKPSTVKEKSDSAEPILRKKIFKATEDFLAREAEEPILKKERYYQLGPSDATLPSSRLKTRQLLGTTPTSRRPTTYNTEDEVNTLLDTSTKHTTPSSTTTTTPTRSAKTQDTKPTKPDTLYSSKPKTKPEGYVSLNRATEISEKHNQTTNKQVSYPHYIPSAPKAERSSPHPERPQTSSLDRPTKNLSSPAPTTTSTTPHNAPKSATDKPKLAPSTSPTSKPSPSPSRVDNNTTRFTKTVKVDNAITRDTTKTRRGPEQEPEPRPRHEPEDTDEGYVPDTKGQRRPQSKRPTSDDEGFEPESPRAGSPTSDFEYRRPTQTDPLDEEDSIFKRTRKTDKKNVTTDFLDTERGVKKPRRPEDQGRQPDEPTGPTDRGVKEPRRKGPLGSNEPRRPEDGGRRPLVDEQPRRPENVSYLTNEPRHPEDEGRKPSHPEDGEPKEPSGPKPRSSKPPLDRSETFEERCRHILGMEDETTTERTKTVQDFIDTERVTDDVRRKPTGRSPSPQKSQLSDTVSIEDCDDDDAGVPRKHPSEKTTTTTRTTKTKNDYPRDRSPTEKLAGRGSRPGDKEPRDQSPLGKTPRGTRPEEFDETTVTTSTLTSSRPRDGSPLDKTPGGISPTDRPRDHSPTEKPRPYDETTVRRTTTRIVDEIDDRSPSSRPRDGSPLGKTPRGSRPTDEITVTTTTTTYDATRPRDKSPSKKLTDDTIVSRTTTTTRDTTVTDDVEDRYPSSRPKGYPRDQSPSEKPRKGPLPTEFDELTVLTSRTTKDTTQETIDDVFEPSRPRDRSPTEKPRGVSPTAASRTPSSHPSEHPRDQSPTDKPRGRSPTGDVTVKRTTTTTKDTTTVGDVDYRSPASRPRDYLRDRSPTEKPTRPTNKETTTTTTTRDTTLFDDLTPSSRPRYGSPSRDDTTTITTWDQSGPRDRSPTEKPNRSQTIITTTEFDTDSRPRSQSPSDKPRRQRPVDSEETDETYTQRTTEIVEGITLVNDSKKKSTRPPRPTEETDTEDQPRGTSPTYETSVRRTVTDKTVIDDRTTPSYPRDQSPSKQPKPSDRSSSPRSKPSDNYPRGSKPTDEESIPRDRSPTGRQPRDQSPSEKPRRRPFTGEETEETFIERTTMTTRDRTDLKEIDVEARPGRRSPSEKPRGPRPLDETPTEKPRGPRPTDETVVQRTVKTTTDHTTVDDRSPRDRPRGTSPTEKPKNRQPTDEEIEFTQNTTRTTRDRTTLEETTDRSPKDRPREKSPSEKPSSRSYPRDSSPTEKPRGPRPTDKTVVQRTVKTTTDRITVDDRSPRDRPRGTSPTEKPRNRQPTDEEIEFTQKTTRTTRDRTTLEEVTDRSPKDRPREKSPSEKPSSRSYPRDGSPTEKPRGPRPTDETVVQRTVKTTTDHTTVDDRSPRDRPRGTSPTEKPRNRQPTDEEIEFTQKTTRTTRDRTTLEETTDRSPKDRPREKSPSEKPSSRSYPRDSSPTEKPRGPRPTDETVVQRTVKTTTDHTTVDDRSPRDRPRGTSPTEKPRNRQPTDEEIEFTQKTTRTTRDRTTLEETTDRSPKDRPREKSPSEKPSSRNYPRDGSPTEKPRGPRPTDETVVQRTVKTTTDRTTVNDRSPRDRPRGTSPTEKPRNRQPTDEEIEFTQKTTKTTRDRTTLEETTDRSPKDRPREKSPSEKASPRSYPRDGSPTEKPRGPRPTDETVVQRTVKTTTDHTTVDDRSPRDRPRGTSPTEKPRNRQPTDEEIEFTQKTTRTTRDRTTLEETTDRSPKDRPREKSPSEKPSSRNYPRDGSPTEKPRGPRPTDETVVQRTVKTTTDRTTVNDRSPRDRPRGTSPTEKPRNRQPTDEEIEFTQKTNRTTRDRTTLEEVTDRSPKDRPREKSPSEKPSSRNYPRDSSPTEKPRGPRPTDETVVQRTVKTTTDRTSVDDRSPRDRPRGSSPTEEPRNRQSTDEEIEFTQKTTRTTRDRTTLEEVTDRSPKDRPREKSPSEKPSSRSYPRDSSPTEKPRGPRPTEGTFVQRTVKTTTDRTTVDDRSPRDHPRGTSPTEKPKSRQPIHENQSPRDRYPENTPRDRSPSEKPRQLKPTDETVIQRTVKTTNIEERLSKSPRGTSPSQKPGYPRDRSPTEKPRGPKPTDQTITRRTVKATTDRTIVNDRSPKDRPRGTSPSEKPKRRQPTEETVVHRTSKITSDRRTLEEIDIEDHPRGTSPSERPRKRRPSESESETETETDETIVQTTIELTAFEGDSPKDRPRGTSPSDKPKRRLPTGEDVEDTVVHRTTKTTRDRTTWEDFEGRSPLDRPRDISPSGKPRDRSPSEKPRGPRPTDGTIVQPTRGTSPSEKPRRRQPTDEDIEQTVVQRTSKTTRDRTTLEEIENRPRGQSPSEKPRSRPYPRDSSPSDKLKKPQRPSNEDTDDTIILMTWTTSGQTVEDHFRPGKPTPRDTSPSGKPRGSRPTDSTVTHKTVKTTTVKDHPRGTSPSEKPRRYQPSDEETDETFVQRTTKTTNRPRDSCPTEKTSPRYPSEKPSRPRTSEVNETTVRSTTNRTTVQETDFEKRYGKRGPRDQSPVDQKPSSQRPGKPITTTTTTTRNRSTLEEQDLTRSPRPKTQPSSRDKMPTKTTPSTPRSQPTIERRIPAELPSPGRKPKTTFGTTTKTTAQSTVTRVPASRPKTTKEVPKKPTKPVTGPAETRPGARQPERRHSQSISPDSSPSRPTSEVDLESPHRSPNTSPSRKSPSPTRSVKLEDITSSVITTKKTTVSIDKSKPKVTHVTTAKFQVSPPTSPTKVISSPDIKPSSTRKPITKVPTPKPTGSRLATEKTTTKKVSTVRKDVVIPTDSERDSEVPTDFEDVDTPLSQKTPNRKMPVMERKESAPVHRVTQVDKDLQKMSRSTSENIIKTSITKRPLKHEPLEPINQVEGPRPTGGKTSPKTERRPSKHLSTKTINLTTFEKVINSQDMENVVIDIQQAKSSREPSPNKIVPTPVSLDLYTGKPRFPDVVQEPEDEPRKKPNVKNIPIFEEETNDFVGCQITEVNEESFQDTTKVRTRKLIDGESRPQRPTPTILTDDNIDSECLLSVHDKVSKFISTAEEVSKPKPSAPFRRDVPEEDVPEDDECLLTVDEKVNKFLKTAENVTRDVITSTTKPIQRPRIDDLDEDIRTDECVLSVSEKVNKFTTKADKLAPSAPQRSPELVARIERQISRQSDAEPESPRETRMYPESPEEEDSPTTVRKVKQTKSLFEREEKKYTDRQIDILSRPSVWDKKPKSDVKLDDILGYRPEDEPESEPEPVDGAPRRKSPVKDQPDVAFSKPSKPITDTVSKRKEIFENKVSTQKTTKTTKPVAKSPERTTRAPTQSPSRKQPSDESDSRYPKQYPSRYPQEPDDIHEDVYGSSKTRRLHESSRLETTTIRQSPERSPTRKSSHPEIRPITKTPTRTPKQPEDHSPSRRYSDDHPRKQPTRDQPQTDLYKETYENSEYTTRRRSSAQKYPEDHSPDRRTPHTKSPSPIRKQPVEEPDDYAFSSLREETNKHHTTRTSHHSPKDTPFNQTSIPDYEYRDHSPARSTSTVSSQKRTTTHKSTSNRVTEDTISRRPRRPSGNEPSTPTSGGRGPRPKGVPETVAARRNIFESSPGDVSPRPGHRRPSYMDHTKSSLEHTRKDSLEITKTNYSRKSSMEDESYEVSPRNGAKFGVGLKHKEEPKPRRKLSSSDIPNIEDVFELELLEEMLNIVTSYEQRRRIRSQIRVVKKLLETKTKEEVSRMTKITTFRKTSSSSVRDSPIPRRDTPMRPDRYHPSDDIDSESIIESRHAEEREEIIRERSISPQSKASKTVAKVTEIRKIGEPTTPKRPISRKDEPKDSKPIWATKNILKKSSENEKVARALSAKKTTSTSSSSTSRTQQTHRQRIAADEDCVTSSYGIGPTDEDGRPLFGIRALKKKTSTSKTAQPSETTKVTGTVITEKYYSENGAEPVGERKVIVYSSNPEDLLAMETQYDRRDSETVKREKLSKDGLTSVTKVQKIGKYKPGEVPAITDDAEFAKTTSKMVRRGSVKEMSEKFIRKESSSSVTEKSSGYPKAGLILRTRTNSGATADTADQYEVRAKSAEYDDESDNECDVEIRTSRKHSKVVTESEDETEIRRKVNTRSFLNSAGSKVTGVDDVLDRMRNADNVGVDGDTCEDREARALLNKFLGASVLMTGMESIIPQKELKRTTTGGDNLKKQELKTTRVTKTTKTAAKGGNSSSPVARETCDFEEIWDEETLKELLEKSTSYEERRSIRARLRQLMAEREACAELVASVKAELDTDKNVKTNSADKKIVQDQQQLEDDSSGSEYEEIIEEYTASEDEDETTKTTVNTNVKIEKLKEDSKTKKVIEEVKKTTITKKEEPKQTATKTIVVEKTTVVKKDAAPSSVEDKKPEIKKDDNDDDDDDEASVSDNSKELSTTTTEKTETKEEDGGVVTTTTKVTTRTVTGAPKPVSPFAKFQQLDKQNTLQSPKSPLTPTTPGGSSSQPIFRFTDPALNARAATVKDQLLQWCQSKTQEYENVQITNFSGSWTDGLAFCALIHHFLPDAFDYSKLNAKQRRYNFELAFRVADEKAGIAPLLDVEDMVVMKRPDWKCVFTYVQSIYRRFRNCQ